MYKNKAQKKYESNTKSTNLIQKLGETEMDIKRLRLEFSWLEDKILYINCLMDERITKLEHNIDEHPF
jgi:hypothetical protein